MSNRSIRITGSFLEWKGSTGTVSSIAFPIFEGGESFPNWIDRKAGSFWILGADLAYIDRTADRNGRSLRGNEIATVSGTVQRRALRVEGNALRYYAAEPMIVTMDEYNSGVAPFLSSQKVYFNLGTKLTTVTMPSSTTINVSSAMSHIVNALNSDSSGGFTASRRGVGEDQMVLNPRAGVTASNPSISFDSGEPSFLSPTSFTFENKEYEITSGQAPTQTVNDFNGLINSNIQGVTFTWDNPSVNNNPFLKAKWFLNGNYQADYTWDYSRTSFSVSGLSNNDFVTLELIISNDFGDGPIASASATYVQFGFG